MANPARKYLQAASSTPEPGPGEGRLARALRRAARVFCAALLLVAFGFGPAPAIAQSEAALRVLILEGPGADWLRRVRGQLSDLPVTIVTLPLVVEGQAEADVLRQLRPLASNRDAALVAWLMIDGTRYDPGASEDTFVAIWFARSGRLYTRRLGPRWQELSRGDRSGVLELGALSVRSAARSLLLDPSQAEPAPAGAGDGGAPDAPGGAAQSAAAQSRAAAQGAERAAQSAAREERAAPSSAPESDGAVASRAESASEPAPPPALQPDEGRIVTTPSTELAPTDPTPSAADPTPSERAGAEAASSRGLHLGWSAELGVSGQLAGPPGHAAAGIAGGLRAASGPWGLSLLGRFGLPLRSELGPSELSLQHHALLVEAQHLSLHWGALELGPLVRGGLALSRRETVAGPAELAAAEVQWSRAVQLGAGALAQYRWGTHWGASLRGVLHWLPRRTGYSLVDDLGDPIASARPWAVQPSLELNASWHW